MNKQTVSYTAYGYTWERSCAALGFNGEWTDVNLQAQLLGNGHRLYRAALMRFYSPDSLSPFSEGGLNAYCYCEGDPTNYSDPVGRMRIGKPTKTGLTAEFKRLGIPKIFKRGVKQYFSEKNDPYYLGIGEAGFRITKENGIFTVAKVPGLGPTYKKLSKFEATFQDMQNKVNELEGTVKKLQTKRAPPKPPYPLPSTFEASPHPPQKELQPFSVTQIRQAT